MDDGRSTMDDAPDRLPSILQERFTHAQAPLWVAYYDEYMPYDRLDMDITNPSYLFYAERIIRKLIGRVSAHPAVIGYQTDTAIASGQNQAIAAWGVLIIVER